MVFVCFVLDVDGICFSVVNWLEFINGKLVLMVVGWDIYFVNVFKFVI